MLFSIFVMMDELTKMLFTKLGLESMPQRSYWIADMFFVEELQRSGDEKCDKPSRQYCCSPPFLLP